MKTQKTRAPGCDKSGDTMCLEIAVISVARKGPERAAGAPDKDQSLGLPGSFMRRPLAKSFRLNDSIPAAGCRLLYSSRKCLSLCILALDEI